VDQTCKAQASDFDKFPFPATATATGLLRDVLTTRKLKVAEYAASAHSTVDPATCDDVETTQPESECEGTYVAATPCEISCQCDDDNPACHGVTCWDRCSCSKPSTCTKGDDWSQDGDYTVTPPTGFWPEYTESLLFEFKAEYGADIELERVWCGWTCTQALLAGAVHMTGPYFLADGFTNDRARSKELAMSCTTMGGHNTFFTLNSAIVRLRQQLRGRGLDTSGTMVQLEQRLLETEQTELAAADSGLGTGVLVVLVSGGVLLSAAVSFLVIMVVKAKRGQPLFVPLAGPQEGSYQGTQAKTGA
jgi:hypothetical protein